MHMDDSSTFVDTKSWASSGWQETCNKYLALSKLQVTHSYRVISVKFNMHNIPNMPIAFIGHTMPQ